MNTAKVAREMASLPPEAQKQILQFLAFLKARYSSSPSTQKVERPQLADEPFVGMWRDREDMRDSTAWVRNQRRWEHGR
jgi:hypothetical protein